MLPVAGLSAFLPGARAWVLGRLIRCWLVRLAITINPARNGFLALPHKPAHVASIEADHGSTTITAHEVQGSSEVHAVSVNVQSLPHKMVLLKMQVANRKQTLKSRNHRLSRQWVGPTQHPFPLKHPRDRPGRDRGSPAVAPRRWCSEPVQPINALAELVVAGSCGIRLSSDIEN